MSSPITLQVKTYLLPDSVKPSASAISQSSEIRRFLLTSSRWSGMYQELLNKITQSYADFIPQTEGEKAICMYWQDEEGDLVGFNCAEEMQFANDVIAALAMSKANYANPPHIFKVYIASKVAAKKATEPVIHPGVVCDGCNNNLAIVGTRFKCQTCPDYDLCSQCEARSVHKETGHVFTKIENPVRRCPYYAGQRPQHCRRGQHNQSSLFGQNLSQFLPVVNNPEELKRFGQHLKTMLEPFGIDVDYFVDNCTRQEGKKDDEPAKSQPSQSPETPTGQPGPSSDEATSSKQAGKKDEKVQVDPEAASSMGPQPQAENPFLQVINMMKNFSAAEEKPVEKNEGTSSAPPQLEDSFVNVDAEVEKELKIIRALESLKQMGYNDDSGWLLRLVVSKEGNINQVLDAISPK